MNSEAFLQHFGHAANAPGGIGRLREMVLHLAFSGKLSVAMPSDEDTDEMLESLEAQQSKFDGKRKKNIDATVTPFHEIPEHWRWVPLAKIGYDHGQKIPKRNFTYIDVSSIDNKRGLISSAVQTVTPERAPSRARKIVKEDTVIYSTVRPYLLNIAVIDKAFEPEPIASTAFAIIHPFDGVISRYIYYYLRSPTFIRYVESAQSGIAYPAINDKKFFSGLFPLAPLAEQNRIVAKVNALMALCDGLEEKQQERAELRPRLAKAAHERFIETPTLESLKTCFADHGHTSPEELRRTILSLAVRGKLIEQDGRDESVEELLVRVSHEKTIASVRGLIKPTKKLPRVPPEDHADQVPKSWTFERLGNLTLRIGSGSTPRGGKNAYVAEGIPFLRSQNIWNQGIQLEDAVFIPASIHAKMSNTVVRPGDILLNITGASLGRCASVPHDFPEANVSQHVSIVRPVVPELRDFIHLFLISPQGQELIWTRQVGMAREGLSKKVLELFEVPIPPLAEQRRIIAKVHQLMALVESLEVRQTNRSRLAECFAKAAVTALTGTGIDQAEKMKTPKTELVSNVRLRVDPNDTKSAPLSELLAKNNGEMPARTLWQRSQFSDDIEAFYQQLRAEVSAGWINKPTGDEATMKVLS